MYEVPPAAPCAEGSSDPFVVRLFGGRSSPVLPDKRSPANRERFATYRTHVGRHKGKGGWRLNMSSIRYGRRLISHHLCDPSSPDFALTDAGRRRYEETSGRRWRGVVSAVGYRLWQHFDQPDPKRK